MDLFIWVFTPHKKVAQKTQQISPLQLWGGDRQTGDLTTNIKFTCRTTIHKNRPLNRNQASFNPTHQLLTKSQIIQHMEKIILTHTIICSFKVQFKNKMFLFFSSLPHQPPHFPPLHYEVNFYHP